MRSVALAEDKARLSALVAEAAAGEPVCIMRRGKPVALIVGMAHPRRRIDGPALRELTDAMPTQPEPAGSFVRRMRNSDRY